MLLGWNRRFRQVSHAAKQISMRIVLAKNSFRIWMSAFALIACVSLGVGQQPPPNGAGLLAGMPRVVDSIDASKVQVGAAGSLIGFSGSTSEGSQTITLVNTEKFWMAVYHVSSDGKIHLVSSRPIDADFSVQLNVTDPLPDEIRGLSDN
jgi:hypothetical protein